MEFEPLIPMSLWLALVVVAAVALGWYALRRPSIMSRGRWAVCIALMGAGLAMIFALLLNPIWARPLPPPAGKPVLTVLVDQSASMLVGDAEGATSRYSVAARIAKQLQSDASHEFDVRLRGFDRSTRTLDSAALEADPAGASTDLGSAISGAIGGDVASGEAVVLLSDGIHNAGNGSASVLDAVRLARAMDAPIFTRTFGGDARQADLAVDLRSAQDLAIIGQRSPITAQITNAGFNSARAVVTLLRDGTEVSKKTIDLAGGSSAEVHFSVSHDAPGVFPYEVRVEPTPGETARSNNSAAYVLRVVAEPVRVLVLEGKPYWDNKFFLRTLMSDQAVAIDSVVRLTESRMLRRVLTHKPSGAKDEKALATRDDAWTIVSDPKELLASAERLRTYQIVVLGRDSEPFLGKEAIANLQDWIADEGGSLVCYRGAPTSSENESLARLMPVKFSPGNRSGERFRLTLTESGEKAEWLRSTDEGSIASLVAAMPSLTTSSVIDAAKPLAVTLANSVSKDNTQSPAVVYQPYGSGRVVIIEGAGMWRWAFLPPKFDQQEGVYLKLWHSMLRWLTSGAKLQPGQKYNLRADKVRFGSTEPATVTVLARENIGQANLPAVELSIEGATEKKPFVASTSGDEVGVFRVSFGALPEGRYRAQLAGAREEDASAHVVFEVRSFDREQLDLRARPDLMARIADGSGGATLGDDVVREVKTKFADYRTRTHPPQVIRTPAWDRWWVLAGVIGLWAVSWFVRRSGGLV